MILNRCFSYKHLRTGRNPAGFCYWNHARGYVFLKSGWLYSEGLHSKGAGMHWKVLHPSGNTITSKRQARIWQVWWIFLLAASPICWNSTCSSQTPPLYLWIAELSVHQLQLYALTRWLMVEFWAQNDIFVDWILLWVLNIELAKECGYKLAICHGYRRVRAVRCPGVGTVSDGTF